MLIWWRAGGVLRRGSEFSVDVRRQRLWGPDVLP